MKKATRILAVGLLAVTLLSGCAKTFTCDLCGETVKERPNTLEILGEEIEICKSCSDELDELSDTFE